MKILGYDKDIVDFKEGDPVRGTEISRDIRTQEQRLKSRKINKNINSNCSDYTVEVVEKWKMSIRKDD